ERFAERMGSHDVGHDVNIDQLLRDRRLSKSHALDPAGRHIDQPSGVIVRTAVTFTGEQIVLSSLVPVKLRRIALAQRQRVCIFGELQFAMSCGVAKTQYW